jgi:hypothetical protein
MIEASTDQRDKTLIAGILIGLLFALGIRLYAGSAWPVTQTPDEYGMHGNDLPAPALAP